VLLRLKKEEDVSDHRSQEKPEAIKVDDSAEQSLFPADVSQKTPQTHSGTVQYDMPPPVRGKTITIEFDEMTEPQPEPVPCCTGAIHASLQFNGRRMLCLGCATIYQYGFKVGQMHGVRRYTGRPPL
jgi:hypothetical protein